jgi:hypothetical protein
MSWTQIFLLLLITTDVIKKVHSITRNDFEMQQCDKKCFGKAAVFQEIIWKCSSVTRNVWENVSEFGHCEPHLCRKLLPGIYICF